MSQDDSQLEDDQLASSSTSVGGREIDVLDREWVVHTPPSRGATWIPFANAFFLVIATVLGTGILGIPVKLAKTGFQPFLLNYFLIFIMQALILIFTVEIMQRGRIVEENERAAEHKAVPLDEFNADEDSEMFFDDAMRKSNLYSDEKLEDDHSRGDLHTLGRMFLLSKWLVILFDIAVMLHFISVLISYALAGSVAWGQLFGLTHTQFTPIIPPFVVVGSVLIVIGATFAPRLFQTGLSIATFFKGSLLLLMVVVTAAVAVEVDLAVYNDWRYIGKPLLIGTVAMGGAVNILPVLFSKIPFRRRDIKIFTAVIIAALFTVWVLNVLWCYFLLKTIPSHDYDGEFNDAPSTTERDNILTLQDAEVAGLPSTVPLVNIIEQQYQQFIWIATTVDVFIVTSITISFVVVGTGMKHVLDGFANELKATPLQASTAYDSSRTCLSSFTTRFLTLDKKWKQIGLYVLSFGFIMAMALANPKSFLAVLERVTSLALNMEAGFFIVLMLVTSRKIANTPIPMVVPDKIYALRWVVMAFFSFAIAYDLIGFILEHTSDIDYL